MATSQVFLVCLVLLVGAVRGQRELFRCDFQTDLCGGQTEGSPSEFVWLRQKGMTSSSGTGPDYDHTQGNSDGYYIYIESSDPRKQGETARYTISNIGSGMRCLRFWYSMIGPNQGQLNVKRSPSDSMFLWTKSGEQKMSMWIQGEVELDASVSSVVFEAVRGNAYQGDTALDDVTVTEGRCSNMPPPPTGTGGQVSSSGGIPPPGRDQIPGPQPPPIAPPPPPPPPSVTTPCGLPAPPPLQVCSASARDMHLQPQYLSQYWPLRFADWFNDTFELYNFRTWPSNFDEWELNAMYPSVRPDPKSYLDMRVTEMAISRFWMAQRPSANTAKVRLVGGSNEREGRVEVLHNNEWGTVCGKDFTRREAQVVCNSIGFYGTAEIVRTFGQGSGRIWLSGLSCDPDMVHLSYCCHNRFGEFTSSCSHSDDIGVRCLDDFWTKVRITGGPSNMEGRLEVHHNGSWGTVCRDGFGEAEAQVACNSLGYWGKADVLPANSYTGSGEIWLDGVRCRAHMPHLSHCVHNEFGVHDCTHAKDVAIRCRLFDVDYSCTNGTSGTMSTRDHPYTSWNQGGETVRNMNEYQSMRALYAIDLYNMINGIKPTPYNGTTVGQGQTPPIMTDLNGKDIEQLWQILRIVTDEIERKKKMMGGPMPA